jgi:hypothetical protein
VLVTDLIVLVMFVTTVGFILSRGRGGHARHVDTVVMRSVPGLIISGTLFGAIALAMVGYGLVMLVRHPMELSRLKIGPVHGWAMGVGSLGLGIVIAFVPYLLFAKLAQILRQPRVARGVASARPAPVEVARVADLPKAQRAALARITEGATIDQLAATARDFLRDAYLTPPADVQTRWQPLLDRLDAARFGGVAADPSALAAELRALVG